MSGRPRPASRAGSLAPWPESGGALENGAGRVQRRTACSSLRPLGARIADPPCKFLERRRPNRAGWSPAASRSWTGRRISTPQQNASGVKARLPKGGVAARRSRHDGEAASDRLCLLHGPRDGVEQVRRASLAATRDRRAIDEPLPKPVGAASLTERTPSRVGEPLVVAGSNAVFVACPRSAMHQAAHGQGRRGPGPQPFGRVRYDTIEPRRGPG